jgi:hypothetical protein
VPAKSIIATNALTATHPIIILEVNLELYESAIKTEFASWYVTWVHALRGSDLVPYKLESRMGNRPAEQPDTEVNSKIQQIFVFVTDFVQKAVRKSFQQYQPFKGEAYLFYI